MGDHSNKPLRGHSSLFFLKGGTNSREVRCYMVLKLYNGKPGSHKIVRASATVCVGPPILLGTPPSDHYDCADCESEGSGELK